MTGQTPKISPAKGIKFDLTTASASNTARFQNGLVESCMLLRSIVKPYVVIALTVLGLGLSFIINGRVVKQLGVALALAGLSQSYRKRNRMTAASKLHGCL